MWILLNICSKCRTITGTCSSSLIEKKITLKNPILWYQAFQVHDASDMFVYTNQEIDGWCELYITIHLYSPKHILVTILRLGWLGSRIQMLELPISLVIQIHGHRPAKNQTGWQQIYMWPLHKIYSQHLKFNDFWYMEWYLGTNDRSYELKLYPTNMAVIKDWHTFV